MTSNDITFKKHVQAITETFVHRDLFFSLHLAIGKSCDQWQHLSTVQDVVVSTSCRQAFHTNSFEEMWSQNETIFGKKRSGVDRSCLNIHD